MAKRTCNPEDVYELFMEGRSIRSMVHYLKGHPTEDSLMEALRAALLDRERQKDAAIAKLRGKPRKWPPLWPKSEAVDDD